MRRKDLVAAVLAPLALATLATLAATSCATGEGGDDAPVGIGGGRDGGCSTCDADGDKVTDNLDKCPNTPRDRPVNAAGCADSQLTPQLAPTFPPFGLTWTPTGDLGRAGGLTWTYSGIQRGDLFHIWWVLCDDPSAPCGISLDGPLNAPTEGWALSAGDSDPSNGKLVFTSASQIPLADAGTPTKSCRLTVTIADASDAPIPFAPVTTLGITTARSGQVGAEIGGTGFRVKAIAEVQDGATWTPYLDYYDAAPTPDTGDAGGGAVVSFGGSFYDK